jgi:hypothetical protein
MGGKKLLMNKKFGMLSITCLTSITIAGLVPASPTASIASGGLSSPAPTETASVEGRAASEMASAPPSQWRESACGPACRFTTLWSLVTFSFNNTAL